MFQEKYLVYRSPDAQPALESLKTPSNTFELNVSPEAQKRMEDWGMEIKNDNIYQNGRVVSNTFGVVKFDVSVEGGELVIKEQNKDVDGVTFEYRGATFEDLTDHMNYVGLNFMLESGMCKDRDILAKCQTELISLKIKHPKW